MHETNGLSVTHAEETLSWGSFKMAPPQRAVSYNQKITTVSGSWRYKLKGIPSDKATERWHHSHHGSYSPWIPLSYLQGTHKGPCKRNHSFKYLLGKGYMNPAYSSTSQGGTFLSVIFHLPSPHTNPRGIRNSI